MESLTHYWNLASIDSTIRLHASEALLSSLNEFSTQDTISTLEDIQSPQLTYALKRLMRGLSSSRDGARQGFSVALTSVLELVPNINCGLILSQLHEISERNGKRNGQEERDLCFARLFGYQALALSGVFKSASKEDVSRVVLEIVRVRKREYLGEVCAFVGLSVLKAVEGELKELVVKGLTEGGVDGPDLVFFCLEGEREFESTLWRQVLPDFKGNDLTLPSNRNRIFDIITKATYYNTQLHPVFQSLFNSYTEKEILSFWGLIETTFFDSSHERKLIGFQVFLKLVPNVTDLTSLFQPNFLRCLINSLSSKETYLNTICKKVTSEVVKVSLEKKKVGLGLVMQLVKNGHEKFDLLTKTKTIETILTNLTSEEIETYLEYLHTKRNNIWVVDQVYTLLRVVKKRQKEWVLAALKFFLLFQSDATLDANVVQLMKDNLILILTSSPLLPDIDLRKSVLLLLLKDPLKGIEPVTSKEKEKKKKGIEPVTFVPLGTPKEEKEKKEEGIELVTKDILIKTLGYIEKTEGMKSDESKAFYNLFVVISLLVYVQDESSSILLDLQNCFDRIFSKSKNEIEPVDVLVDILISFLAKSSAGLRGLAKDVYKVFVGRSTKSTLALFVDVLDTKETFEDYNSSDSSDSDSNSNSDPDSDSDSDLEDSDHSEQNDKSDDEMEILKEKIKVAMETDVEVDLKDLEDEDMEPFDLKLQEIFKEKKNLKKVKKDSKQAILHFKIRVSDLLEIFVKSISQPDLYLAAVTDLLTLHGKTTSDDDKILKDKFGLLLVKLAHLKPDGINQMQALDVLQGLHDRCHAQGDPSNILTSLSIALSKAILNSSESLSKKRKGSPIDSIAAIYESSFALFLKSKSSKLKPKLFLDLNRLESISTTIMLPFVLLLTGPEKKKVFNVIKGFEVLATLLKSSKAPPETQTPFLTLFTSALIQTLLTTPISEGNEVLTKERLKILLKVLITLLKKSKGIEGINVEEVRRAVDVVEQVKRVRCNAVVTLIGQVRKALQ